MESTERTATVIFIFLFKQPIAPTPTNQQLFFPPSSLREAEVYFTVFYCKQTTSLLSRTRCCWTTWLSTQEHNTQHTLALYFSLSVESDGKLSNDWFPSVKNTACGQLHFRKKNKEKKKNSWPKRGEYFTAFLEM